MDNRWPWRMIVGAAAGAVVAARGWQASSLGERWWAVVLTVVVTCALAVALKPLSLKLPWPGSIPALLGVVQFAIYCCVPETDQIPDVAGAVFVLLLAEVGIRRAAPWWVHLGMFSVVLWTGIFGATGRDSALVGALFAAWPLALAAFFPRRSAWCALFGSIAVVVVARTGALQPTVEPAIVAVAIASLLSGAAAWLVSRQRGAHPLNGVV